MDLKVVRVPNYSPNAMAEYAVALILALNRKIHRPILEFAKGIFPLPLAPDTRHIIDEAAFQAMKPGVMLINTGRGVLIDTHALINALKSCRVEYAGLMSMKKRNRFFFVIYLVKYFKMMFWRGL
jgi:lactate dehydrogenase-like 2-hydroxyacid dehydrogenase